MFCYLDLKGHDSIVPPSGLYKQLSHNQNYELLIQVFFDNKEITHI
ncbi:hypothetical protein Sps_04014 [Shewanella psychrophila]|uniref:Uncharacterized protein n=1 Tax=Shewanella psychrophila TaxID=225848 RepID=A0A1S6HUG6_9GAMM|nr:hypothetical protein Sps_04007 [Shewanella psychrophila]AQS39129.1 hypothetical protein Sps_04014 [Shewanella psychrophila]